MAGMAACRINRCSMSNGCSPKPFPSFQPVNTAAICTEGMTRDELAAATLRATGRDLAPTRLKLSQPPLITIRGIRRVLFQGFFEPTLAHDLLSLPATALQNEQANFCHVARPHRKTTTGLDNPIGIFQPRTVRNAQRTKEMAFGKLVRPQPGSFGDDLSENNGKAAAVSKPRPGRCDDWPFQRISHRVFASIHGHVIVASVVVRVRPFVPGKSHRHGKQMFQANGVSLSICKNVGVFRKRRGDLFIDAADELPIDGDPDQNGGDALGGRMIPCSVSAL